METDTRHTSAAALHAAILSAAEFAPEIEAHLLNRGHYFKGPDRELPAMTSAERSRIPLHDIEWRGPLKPIPAPITFHYTVGSARGSASLRNTRPRLLDYAAKVHGARLAFDGKTRRPARPSPVNGSAPHISARGAWKAKDYAAALTFAQSIGPVYLGAGTAGSDGSRCMYMTPEEIEFHSHSFTIGRAVSSGKFRVLHTDSALTLDNQRTDAPDNGFKSHSLALAWLESRMAEDAFREKLDAAIAQAPTFDQSAALAQFEAGSANEEAEHTPTAEIAPPAAPEPAADVGVPEPAPEAVAADPDLIRSAWNDATPAAPVKIPLCAPTPLQYLPIFVRLAIEWIDSNSEMRNTQALDDMIDAYATTYGRAADDQERKSAHYLCARRFGNFLVIPADPAPTAPLPRVLYSEFIRSAGKREAPMTA